MKIMNEILICIPTYNRNKSLINCLKSIGKLKNISFFKIKVLILDNSITNNSYKIIKKFNLRCIEDAAEGLGSYYKKKHVGTFGDIGMISFNGNKIITTGGGGVLITNNKKYALNRKK